MCSVLHVNTFVDLEAEVEPVLSTTPQRHDSLFFFLNAFLKVQPKLVLHYAPLKISSPYQVTSR